MSHTTPHIPLFLNNILHVLAITKNLLSISQFTKDNDVVVEFNSEFCLIKNKNSKKVLLQGGLKHDLYQLDLSSIRDKFTFTKLRALFVSRVNNACKVCNPNLECVCKKSCKEVATAYIVKSGDTSNKCADSVSIVSCCNVNRIRSCNAFRFDNKNSIKSLWHNKLGHPSFPILKQILRGIRLPCTTSTSLDFFDACQCGKLHQLPFPSSKTVYKAQNTP